MVFCDQSCEMLRILDDIFAILPLSDIDKTSNSFEYDHTLKLSRVSLKLRACFSIAFKSETRLFLILDLKLALAWVLLCKVREQFFHMVVY